MTDKRLVRIGRQIEEIKLELMGIEEMRPGSLTKQYRDAEEKKWEFYQLSYTHKMKSKTNYVRAHHVAELKEQIKTYKKFKKLVEKWIALAIEHSKIKMELDNRNRI
jgi:choline kinase